MKMRNWKLIKIEISTNSDLEISKITLWSIVFTINILGLFLSVDNISKFIANCFIYIKQVNFLVKGILLNTIFLTILLLLLFFVSLFSLKFILFNYLINNIITLLITLIRIIIKK